ncbi:nuclease-related domain-containing protein [Streptomyces sp. NPDC048278]|uniref:nuclease-related domain-containing protein n=1 Tax=Streptomyces sp. NPDC048278 TaxID=3155809 RepID=UPI00344818E4
MFAGRGPSATQRLRTKLLRQSSEWDSWYAGLEGERRVGRELERLSSFGWRVLHSVEKINGGDIDHLLIGPGGVFAINTEANYVREVLGRYCDFAVPVEPALVFVGVASLKRAATQYAVRRSARSPASSPPNR